MSHTTVKEWGFSKPFRFLIGPQKTEFTIHSALVAQQSPAMAALVTNGMEESLWGCASLPQYDVETFVRFVEYVYTGEFESPGFTKDIQACDDESIIDLHSETPSPFHLSRDTMAVWHKVAFTGRLLALNDGALMQLCMNKLQDVMRSNKEASVIVELFKFCFVEHTLPKLREAVLEYCAVHLSYLLMDSDFTKLVKKDPELMLLLTKTFMRLLECGEKGNTDEKWQAIQEDKKKRMRPRMSPSGSRSH
ncbi:hypothetical protein LLEC1_01675 [Akanthomyces lecanii]|uniref:BTB domain-containing protein n=1 Tax=Cordyceps confragosa TaxID=2714763 RepID=A0A179IED0_CORDF|nr:hypothetical protein LLEC1_01675 [Akanthomyces lecanii]